MIIKVQPQEDYELLDTGEGHKLERYGDYVLIRPDPEALWNKSLPSTEWEKAHLEFIRKGTKTHWVSKGNSVHTWTIEFGGLTFLIQPSSFKHTGLFPEQVGHWTWMEDIIKKNKENYVGPISILNLFAYTGGATLACAKSGASVCHVDGSKPAVEWARQNATLSHLEDAPIRWIVDDVLAFMKREIKRGKKYDAIIMDPPAFGHGPKDELWKIENNFLELMECCKKILSDKPLFVVINGYTAGYSPLVYENNLRTLMEGRKGVIESGELALSQSHSDIVLPCGIFARWERK